MAITLRNLLAPLVDQALASLAARGALTSKTASYNIEPPKNAAHGDLACNVAMVIQKAEGKPPRAIAELLKQELIVVDTAGVLKAIDIAGPGFLNVTLADSAVQRIARAILVAGDGFGRRPPRSTGKKVMVEFVSANPTGPVHIGHARGSFLGDATSRLLLAAGHDVTREYYINDFGKQVETLGRTIYKRYLEHHGRSVTLVEGEYPAQYVKDIALAWKNEVGDRYLDQPESAWLDEAIAVGIRENLKAIKATLAKANIHHDVFTSEAALHQAGKVTGVVEHYRARGVTYEADRAKGTDDKVRRDDSKAAQYEERQQGGTFLTTSTQGDSEDRVILRKDGTPVYLTADLAYHKDKFDRGFDRMIDVFGADHDGHVPRIRAGVRLLGVDDKKLEFLLVQMVRITREGQEVKVSKRKGTVFELADLIEEAGADACRFLFLMKTANAHMDFDLGLVEKRSKDNPVYYFQYGHARCAQIMKRADSEGKAFIGVDRIEDKHLQGLVLPEERALLKKMAMLEDVVGAAAEALEPHRVLYFCQELIAEFHSYYTKYKNSERVVSDDADKTQGRLAMVAALKQTLRSAFSILGVDAPDYMPAPSEGDDDEEAAA